MTSSDLVKEGGDTRDSTPHTVVRGASIVVLSCFEQTLLLCVRPLILSGALLLAAMFYVCWVKL